MKIYLSEFKILDDYERGNSCDDYIRRFVSFCKINAIEIVRSDVFTDYETINSEIESSNAVVAFVDKWWLSSSWKAHEVLHPFRKARKDIQHCRVILFLIQEEIPPIFIGIKDELECVRSYEELEHFTSSNFIA